MRVLIIFSGLDLRVQVWFCDIYAFLEMSSSHSQRYLPIVWLRQEDLIKDLFKVVLLAFNKTSTTTTTSEPKHFKGHFLSFVLIPAQRCILFCCCKLAFVKKVHTIFPTIVNQASTFYLFCLNVLILGQYSKSLQ